MSSEVMTIKELADIIGISQNGIKYHLDNLKKTGLIERVGFYHSFFFSSSPRSGLEAPPKI